MEEKNREKFQSVETEMWFQHGRFIILNKFLSIQRWSCLIPANEKPLVGHKDGNDKVFHLELCIVLSLKESQTVMKEDIK